MQKYYTVIFIGVLLSGSFKYLYLSNPIFVESVLSLHHKPFTFSFSYTTQLLLDGRVMDVKLN